MTTAPHVDRANISSYDYSAVLYLNTQSRGKPTWTPNPRIVAHVWALPTRLCPVRRPSPQGYTSNGTTEPRVPMHTCARVLFVSPMCPLCVPYVSPICVAGFAGGDFAFVDEGGDEVIEPRAGRCLLFTAGFEHLHRVGAVTKGNRFVLASWFTLSATAGDALQPAHYE